MRERRDSADRSAFAVGGVHQDELFDALAHSHRRFTLGYLRTGEPPLSVRELTTELATWEGQRPVDDRSGGSDRDAIGISLVHNHLPKMVEAGLVTHDAMAKTVALADRADEGRAYLRAMGTD